MGKKKNHKVTRSARYIATEILDAIENEGAYSNLLLNASIEKNALSEQDIGLLTELVYGVTQRRLTLDYGLSPFIRTPDKMQSWVRNLLRLSVYQMVYLDKIPDHAIIYEAGEIAKQKGHAGIVKLVNGILRNVQRKGLKNVTEIQEPLKRMSVQYSTPLWLVELFTKEIGSERTETMLQSLLERPYVTVRVQDADKVAETAEKLKEEGIVTEKSPLSPVGLRILSGKVVQSSLFKQGEITIQDDSSQLVALFGQLNAASHVLDACAAPGGKTMHMASYVDEEKGGVVHALDIHEHKIQLIQQNANRMQVSNRVKTHLLDAKEVAKNFEPETFDTIFVDAPCSGLGLMRRKPEIKYGIEPATFGALHAEQSAILDAVEPLLKKGGTLVYSTCTIVKQENQETLSAFLAKHPSMKQLSVNHPAFTESVVIVPQEAMTSDGYVHILPDAFQSDGFFIGVMKKVEQ